MNPRLLFVDDDPCLLKALKRLHRRSYEIDTTTDPLEGLALATSGEPYGAIVSDLLMPGMDGLTLLKLIHERSASTKLILLTGAVTSEEVEEAVQAGIIWRTIIKPCSRETLSGAVNEAMGQDDRSTAA